MKNTCRITLFYLLVVLPALTAQPQDLIDIGTTPGDGTGESLRSALSKVNTNFTETYRGTPEAHSVDYNDAHPAIEAAMADAGAAVLRSENEYLLTDKVTMESGQALVSNNGRALLEFPGHTEQAVLLNKGSDQYLRGIHATQGLDTCNTSGSLPLIHGNWDHSDLTIVDCRLDRCDRQAIAIFNVDNVESDNVQILGCTIFQTGRAAVVIDQGRNALVANNTIEYTGDDAIAFTGLSRSCTAINNIIDYPGAVYASPNSPTGNDGQGYALKAHGQGIRFADNTVTNAYSGFVAVKPGNFSDGTDQWKPDKIFIVDNRFDGLVSANAGGASARNGIRLASGSGTATGIGLVNAEGNYFNVEQADGTKTDFIGISQSTDRVEIVGNPAIIGCAYLINMATAGIDELVFHRNDRIEFSESSAIRVGHDMSLLEIRDCEITASATDAALIQSTGDVTVDKLVLEDVDLHGTFDPAKALLQWDNSGAVITELVINDCTLNGVSITGVTLENGASVTSQSINEVRGDTLTITGRAPTPTGGKTILPAGYELPAGWIDTGETLLSQRVIQYLPGGELATGGLTYDIDDNGDQWRVHEFTAGDDLVVAEEIDVEYLLIAGGGGGGMSDTRGAGGGGAGGVLIGTATLSAGTYPVVVGAGGAGAVDSSTAASDGSDSTFNSLTAIGGGGGCSAGGNIDPAGDGGSGGGGGQGDDANVPGGSGTAGQGNDGGDANRGGTGGGGGGYSAVGGDGLPAGNDGGLGGAGLYSPISGTWRGFASGGNGSPQSTEGDGVNPGDGGDAGTSTTSHDGADGILLVRYRID